MRSTVQEQTKTIKDMLAIHSMPLYFDIFATSRKISLTSCTAKTTEPTRVNLQEEEAIFTCQRQKEHIIEQKLQLIIINKNQNVHQNLILF